MYTRIERRHHNQRAVGGRRAITSLRQRVVVDVVVAPAEAAVASLHCDIVEDRS